jgi:hypothetical protein
MSVFNTTFWIISILLCIIGWLSITLLLKKIDDKAERTAGQRKLNVIMAGFCLSIVVIAFYPQTVAPTHIIIGLR